jgi:hypothetical protein
MTKILTIRQTLAELPVKNRKTPRRVLVEERFAEELSDGQGTVVLSGTIGADDVLVLSHEGDLYVGLDFETVDGVPTRKIVSTANFRGETGPLADTPVVAVADLTYAEVTAFETVWSAYRPIAGEAMVLDGRVVDRRPAEDFVILVDAKNRKSSDGEVSLFYTMHANTRLYKGLVAAPIFALPDLAELDPDTSIDVIDVGAFTYGDRKDVDHFRTFNGISAAAFLDRIRQKLPIVDTSFLRIFAEGLDASEAGDHRKAWQCLEQMTHRAGEGTGYVVPTLGTVAAALLVDEKEALREHFRYEPTDEADPEEAPEAPAARPAAPRP